MPLTKRRRETSCSGSSSPVLGARTAPGWSKTRSRIPTIRAHAEQSFVPVKLRSDVNEELALGFGLSGLPATVIVAPSREVFAVRQGYLGPDELGKLLAEATARHDDRAREEPANRLGQTFERGQGGTSSRSPKSQAPRPRPKPSVALSGYCPVSLVSDRKLVQGQAEYTVTHEGQALPVRQHADLQPLPPRPRAVSSRSITATAP